MINTVARLGLSFGKVALAMSFLMSSGRAQTNTGELQRLVTANSDFGFRLLKELAQERPGSNLFISPYSVSSVLQMLNNGAGGRTREELEVVLGAGLPAENLNAAYTDLAQSIGNQTNVVLNIANAIWYRAGVQLDPQFVAINRKFYQTTLDALDFAAENSVRAMNEWASQNTHGKIQAIIQPPIPGDAAVILANAIYFKGMWRDPFDAAQTQPRAFYPPEKSPLQVPMMQKTQTFLYQQSNGFQAIQLPYAGNELFMQILLPVTNSTLQGLLGQIDVRFWEHSLLPSFHEQRGTLLVPRFKLRYGADLKASLAALGLKSALSQDADFSQMSSTRLFLSQVKHQSFVDVNEQGTEAAAVTTGVMALASFRNQPPPFQMVVDRPFLFAISHRSTRSILFLGVVLAPDLAGD